MCAVNSSYISFYFFASTQVLSMHIIGGDLTYEFVSEVSPGVNRYEFILTVYRDCNGGGAPFDAEASIAIYRGNISAGVLVDDFMIARGGVGPNPCRYARLCNQYSECVCSKYNL